MWRHVAAGLAMRMHAQSPFIFCRPVLLWGRCVPMHRGALQRTHKYHTHIYRAHIYAQVLRLRACIDRGSRTRVRPNLSESPLVFCACISLQIMFIDDRGSELVQTLQKLRRRGVRSGCVQAVCDARVRGLIRVLFSCL